MLEAVMIEGGIMMKKTFILLPLVVLLMLALVGCGDTGPENGLGTDTLDGAALLDLLDNYQEGSPSGEVIMQALKDDPALFLETLAESTNTEQLLILIGSTIAEAGRNDTAAYDEYLAALAAAEADSLSADAEIMLGFIYANIEVW